MMWLNLFHLCTVYTVEFIPSNQQIQRCKREKIKDKMIQLQLNSLMVKVLKLCSCTAHCFQNIHFQTKKGHIVASPKIKACILMQPQDVSLWFQCTWTNIRFAEFCMQAKFCNVHFAAFVSLMVKYTDSVLKPELSLHFLKICLISNLNNATLNFTQMLIRFRRYALLHTT